MLYEHLCTKYPEKRKHIQTEGRSGWEWRLTENGQEEAYWDNGNDLTGWV